MPGPPDPDRPPTYSRRSALGLGAAAVIGAVTAGPSPAGATSSAAATAGSSASTSSSSASGASSLPRVLEWLRPTIAGREAWGDDLPVVAPILAEEDVRFLLVHHTASTNDYGPDEVVDQIRGFHAFHTGPEKGWPDVAYNFFVDRFGGIWEARQGSLAGAVRGDATGGSQGFALLCSLIGDHSQVPLSSEARSSLVALLAWLAERHGLTTDPGTTVEFVSRGSNRWPQGTAVTAATIAGHRDMSQTSCPGDFAYDLVALDLPRAVTERRRAAVEAVAAASASTTPPPASTTEPTTTSSTTSPTSGGDSSAVDGADGSAAGPVDTDGPLGDSVAPLALAGGAAALGAAALAARRRSRTGSPARADDER